MSITISSRTLVGFASGLTVALIAVVAFQAWRVDASAYRVLSVQAYGRLRELIETTVGSSLIYMNSNAADFFNPEVRKHIDRYIRGSEGTTAVERVKIMKLLWDAIGSEFGARHGVRY